MATKLIGRKEEQEALSQCVQSNMAEFVAVYGRRRIGKTFLVKTFFKEKFDFYLTGIYNGTKAEQLTLFNKQLCAYSNVLYPRVNSWLDAFEQLKHYLSHIKKRKIIIFIDEMPWLDTPRSGFVRALELFWNGWADTKSQIKLIVCGSATTWMISTLFQGRGGLHNRVTKRIKLQPFTLAETEQYLKSNGIVWNRYQIAEAYMILGGTPYYLQKLQKKYSLSQNVDYLFFSKNAELRDEYNFLFRSLFNDSSLYRAVVELLSKKAKGMTRPEMTKALNSPEGGAFSEILENLCNCDFIRKYVAFGKKERDVMYQLTDCFTLFYLKFVKNSSGKGEHLWSNMTDSPTRLAWCGYSFEQLCLHHIYQIKKALGISGVQSAVCSWSAYPDKEHGGAQIDLLIDRKDQVINLCEIKYSKSEYEITKRYNDRLQERRELFRSLTKTRKALHLTMITTYGLKRSMYYGMVQSEVTLNDLFAESPEI